jgi:hypothetical protein
VKFLAVSNNTGDPTPLLEDETAHMAELTAAGVVEQTFLKADFSGVVLIVEAAEGEAAARRLSELPLVRQGITAFTLTELATLPG